MKTGAGEAGSSADSLIIRRHISAPLAFAVDVEIDGNGSFYGVDIFCRADYSIATQFELRRAAWYVNGEMIVANASGELAADLLARLPADGDCDIEAAILREVEAVQALHSAPSFKGGRRHG